MYPYLYYIDFENIFPLVEYMREIHKRYGYNTGKFMVSKSRCHGIFQKEVFVRKYNNKAPHRIRVPTEKNDFIN
jgi:hypothetical protein